MKLKEQCKVLEVSRKVQVVSHNKIVLETTAYEVTKNDIVDNYEVQLVELVESLNPYLRIYVY